MTAYLLSDDCKATTRHGLTVVWWLPHNCLFQFAKNMDFWKLSISDELGIGSRQKHIGNFNQDHFHAVKYNSDVGSIHNLGGKQ